MNGPARNERVEELIAEWLLWQYRADGEDEHLRDCPETVLSNHRVSDGTYGCDTGCSAINCSATASCPHGNIEAWTQLGLGILENVIKDLIMMDQERQRVGST